MKIREGVESEVDAVSQDSERPAHDEGTIRRLSHRAAAVTAGPVDSLVVC